MIDHPATPDRPYAWVLRNRVPVPVYDLADWQDRDRGENAHRVALTEVNGRRVSTVFLGVDHSWGDGPPLLFETMTFPEQDCELCSTWNEAVAQHERAVAAAKALPPRPV